MKIFLPIVFIFLNTPSFSQPDISGTWHGKVFDLQNTNIQDSVSITFKLSLGTDNKITGTCTSYYPGGFFGHTSIFGKFYKKKDGFYIQEDKLLESNFRIKIATHYDRYDFAFEKNKTNELTGTSICIKAMSMHVPCHGNLPITIRKDVSIEPVKQNSDSTVSN